MQENLSRIHAFTRQETPHARPERLTVWLLQGLEGWVR